MWILCTQKTAFFVVWLEWRGRGGCETFGDLEWVEEDCRDEGWKSTVKVGYSRRCARKKVRVAKILEGCYLYLVVELANEW